MSKMEFFSRFMLFCISLRPSREGNRNRIFVQFYDLLVIDDKKEFSLIFMVINQCYIKGKERDVISYRSHG
jgi:uncharacterized protein with ParB-like and HNH nuclease domain